MYPPSTEIYKFNIILGISRLSLCFAVLSRPAVVSLTHRRRHKTRCEHPHAGRCHSLGRRDLHRHWGGGYLFGQALKSHPARTHKAFLLGSQAARCRLLEDQSFLITTILSCDSGSLGGEHRTRMSTARSPPRRVCTSARSPPGLT